MNIPGGSNQVQAHTYQECIENGMQLTLVPSGYGHARCLVCMSAQKNIPIHRKQPARGCPIGITNFYCCFLLCKFADVESAVCMIILRINLPYPPKKSLLQEKGRLLKPHQQLARE